MKYRWAAWDLDTHPDTIRALAERAAYCDICDRAIPRRTPECETCGLALCDGCRESAEHAEYHGDAMAEVSALVADE